MNLDDLNRFKQLDSLNMLGEIENLPDQLAHAFQLGMKHELPDWTDIKQVVVAGMGASAIGADLLAAYCASLAPLPVAIHRDYGLPFSLARSASSPPIHTAMIRHSALRAASKTSSVSSVLPECDEQIISVSVPRAKKGSP